MALSFLSNVLGTAGQFAGPISSILSTITGAKNNKKYDKQQEQIFQELMNRGPSAEEQYAQSIYKALADPNNSLVKQTQDAEYQDLMNAINQGIQGKVLSDRREAAMGRRPTYFDPERADESISYQLSRGAPAALLQAKQNARTNLTSAATGVGGYSEAADKRTTGRLGARQDYLDYQRERPSGVSQFGDLFKSIGGGIEGLLGVINGGRGGGASTSRPMGPYLPSNMSSTKSGELIRWNQKRY